MTPEEALNQKASRKLVRNEIASAIAFAQDLDAIGVSVELAHAFSATTRFPQDARRYGLSSREYEALLGLLVEYDI